MSAHLTRPPVQDQLGLGSRAGKLQYMWVLAMVGERPVLADHNGFGSGKSFCHCRSKAFRFHPIPGVADLDL
jgi:hypothetical protein